MFRTILLGLLIAAGLSSGADAQCSGAGGVPFNCQPGSTPAATDLFLGGNKTGTYANDTVSWSGLQVATGLFALAPQVSGGGTVNFLRADGQWAVPPGTGGGGGGGTSPGGSSGQVQFNSGGNFGGLTNTQLTADINLFSSALPGAVPASSGSATTYLNGAGGWTTPAGLADGTVTSVGLSVPSFLTVAGSPVISSGTLAISLASESANAVWAGPTSGTAATPGFRALVDADLPSLAANQIMGALTATTPSGLTVPSCSATGNVLQWTAGGGFGCTTITPGTGTVTSVALTVPTGFAVSGSPITANGTLAMSLASESANTVWAGPASGGAVVPGFRALVAADMPPANLATSAQGGVTGTLPAANGGTGVTSLGTGVATALGNAVGASGGLAVGGGALGTPSSLTLTNATGLPITTGLTGTLNDTAVWTVPSTGTVAAGTVIVIPAFRWTSGTITAIHYATGGTTTPSFTAAVQIGGTNVTGCNALTVSSSTDASATCTAANALVSGNQVTIVVSGVTGAPAQSYVQINFSHSVP